MFLYRVYLVRLSGGAQCVAYLVGTDFVPPVLWDAKKWEESLYLPYGTFLLLMVQKSGKLTS